jgi:hypothetical protein
MGRAAAAIGTADRVKARRIVNGLDKADAIEGYALKNQAGIGDTA